MRQFARDHPPRDDADDLTARRQRRVGQDAHQPNIAAAIDERQLALGQDGAAVPGGGGVFRQRAGA
jgi:hypothetical protein